MTFVDEPTVEHQPCGCKTTTFPVISNGTPIVQYEPCLPCALKNAGIMLQQAGLRMTEAEQEAEREEMEALAEEVRRRTEDFIGGSD